MNLLVRATIFQFVAPRRFFQRFVYCYPELLGNRCNYHVQCAAMSSSSDRAFGNAPFVLQLVSASVKIAETAGEVIRNVMHEGTLNIVTKDGMKNVQTEADRLAQASIVASLHKRFPNSKMQVIGEEEHNEDHIRDARIELGFCEEVLSKPCPENLKNVLEDNVVVWVDPLDGTAEFTESKENPELREHVTVLIGIAVSGRPVAGVIHQPYYHRDQSKPPGRTVWGIIGVGAFGLHVDHPPKGEHIITTTRSHADGKVNSAINALKPTQVLRVGGAGHKVMLVIEGHAHAYVFASPGCKKWDTCAPEAVLLALGGKLTDLHGNHLEYHATVKHPNSGGILATPASVTHDWYVEQIPDDVKASLKP